MFRVYLCSLPLMFVVRVFLGFFFAKVFILPCFVFFYFIFTFSFFLLSFISLSSVSFLCVGLFASFVSLLCGNSVTMDYRLLCFSF